MEPEGPFSVLVMYYFSSSCGILVVCWDWPLVLVAGFTVKEELN